MPILRGVIARLATAARPARVGTHGGRALKKKRSTRRPRGITKVHDGDAVEEGEKVQLYYV